MKKVDFVFQHGWGFDGASWGSWVDYLAGVSSFDCEFKIADRGYFGTPRKIEGFSLHSDNDTKNVVVCHSLGLHLLPAGVLTRADVVFVLNGFLHFHPSDATAGKRSRRVLQKMLSRLEEDPQAVLSDFYQKCFNQNDRWPLLSAADIAYDQLYCDLRKLDESSISADELAPINTIVLVDAEFDQVVVPEVSAELAEHLPAAHRYTVRQSGHALPFSHPMRTCMIVEQVLTQLFFARNTSVLSHNKQASLCAYKN